MKKNLQGIESMNFQIKRDSSSNLMGGNKACHRIKNSGKSENKAFKRKLGPLEKQNITNLSREGEKKKKRMTDDEVMPSKFWGKNIHNLEF